jgi:hypothetical protein
MPTKLLALFVVVLTLTACGKWEAESTTKSPSGRLDAVAEYKGSAACCSDHSRLSLQNREGGMLTDPGIAVEATNARLKAHWISDDDLIVEACNATQISVKSRTLREPVVNSDGSINAVRIEVVTAPNTERNGQTFCLESPAN